MQKLLTMSPKGQITLPKEMRELLGLRDGDDLVCNLIGEELIITAKSIDFNDLAGLLGDPPNGTAELGEIEATILEHGGRNVTKNDGSGEETQAA